MSDDYDFRGPWLTPREAQLYVRCKTLHAWHQWKHAHGIIARANYTVAKADLDRELHRKRSPRRMAPASLANLHRRRSA